MRKRVDIFRETLYNGIVMEQYRHEETFKVGFCDADFKDEIKISSLLSYFETAASNSAEELGFGYSYLKAHGYAFFLLSSQTLLQTIWEPNLRSTVL